MSRFKGLVVDFVFLISGLLVLGDFFNTMGCIGGVSFIKVLEGFQVRVRIIEVMESVSVGVVTLF